MWHYRCQVFRVACCFTLILVGSSPAFVSVEAAKPEIVSVNLGFGGRYKVGCWSPVRVQLKSGEQGWSGEVRITATDGDGVPATYAMIDQTIQLDANQTLPVETYVKLGRTRGSLLISLIDDDAPNQIGERVHNYSSAATGEQQLVVQVGSRIGLDEVMRIASRYDVRIAEVNSPSTLPMRWWGYEGVATLIVNTGELERFSEFSSEQVNAISDWVRMGGQLILSVGRNGQELMGPEGVMEKLAPGKFRGVVDQWETIGLENFTDANHPIEMGRDRLGRSELEVTQFEDPMGKIEVVERSGSGIQPVIFRSTFGFGQIVLVAVDLDIPPISTWTGRNRLLVRLLEWTLGVDQHREGAGGGAVRHAGYTDLTGQLRSALDQFRQVAFVPFWLVAVIVVGYLLLIGPIDFLLLRYQLRRMEWTWVTFPAIVVGATLGSYYLACYLKGDRLLVNQVDIVDVDVPSRMIRGTSWMHLYSPATAEYELSVVPAVPIGAGRLEKSGALFSWQGLPGSALGGMNSVSKSSRSSEGYTIHVADKRMSQPPGIEGLPVHIWSTKAFNTRWWGKTSLGSIAELKYGADRMLRGEFHNLLDVELTDCYLYFSPSVYHIGKLAVGSTVAINSSTVRRNLRWRMTRRTLSELSDINLPWDQFSRDVPRIIDMMMLHETAGGEAYTGLRNHYQPFVDLSTHLELDRAILVGRAKRVATILSSDNESVTNPPDQTWVFYRFVLPATRLSSKRLSHLDSRNHSTARN